MTSQIEIALCIHGLRCFCIIALIWADFFAMYAIWETMTYLTDVWKLDVTHAAMINNIWGGITLILPVGFAYIVDGFLGNYGMLAVSSVAFSIGLGFLSLSTPPVLHKYTGTCSAYEPECIGRTQKALFYTSLALLAIGIAGHNVSLHPFLSDQDQTEDVDVSERSEHDVSERSEHDVFERSEHDVSERTEHDASERREHDVSERTEHDVAERTEHDAVERSEHDVSERNEHDVSERSQHDVSKRSLIIRRIKGKNKKIKPRDFIIFFSTLILGLLLSSAQSWSMKFGFSAICTSGATIIFLVGSSLYIKKEVEGSPITHIGKVILAAIARSAEQLPSPSDLVVGDGNLPHTNGLRCLDKAAIRSSVYGENNWRVCTVTEVEETKIVFRMVPMWITSIMCGVVLSAGNTYFLEQANNLNTQVGKIKVNLLVLLLVQIVGKKVFCLIYKITRSLVKQKWVPLVGISVAMTFSMLCCITAADVEARRLDVINSLGLADWPDETIPMTIFWLLPQFLLLSGVEAFFDSSVTDLFRDQFPTSMVKYFSFFTKGIRGLGYLVSVLSVYVLGELTERIGRKSWFQYTLSKSRLDYYFWTLAAFSELNLLVYIVMAIRYYDKKPTYDENEPDEEQGNRDEEQGSRDEEQGSMGEEQGSRDEEQGNRDEEQGNRDEEQGNRDEEQGNRDEEQD